MVISTLGDDLSAQVPHLEAKRLDQRTDVVELRIVRFRNTAPRVIEERQLEVIWVIGSEVEYRLRDFRSQIVGGSPASSSWCRSESHPKDRLLGPR